MKGLVKVDTDLVVKNEDKLDDFLKPFTSEVLLFTTKIANTFKVADKLPILNLKCSEELFFKLGHSKYEDNQIEIYTKENKIVGYVPEQDSVIFARLMDAGKRLGAKIKSISQSRTIPLIEIDIYLIDF